MGREKIRFPIRALRFSSATFSGPDETRRVAQEFVDVITWQQVKGFNIDHEAKHALADLPMTGGRAQGRFLLYVFTVELPFSRRWVWGLPAYEPIGERTKEEWKQILGAPKIPSPVDIFNLIRLKVRR